MKKINLVLSAMVSLLLIGSASYSQDWTQWRGANRDGIIAGFKEPSAWPAQLTQKWKIQVGFGDATPVMNNNKIYLNTRQGDNEIVLCLDAETGKEIWRNQYASSPVTGPAGSHPGPRSTPVVSDGKVVTFGATGILSCLDAETGKLVWRKDNPTKAVPEFFTAMSPLIYEKTCYVHLGMKDSGRIVAYDLATGNEKWKWEGDGPSYASPAIMTFDSKKQLIVQSEKNLLGLNIRDGKLLWKLPTEVKQRYYNCVSPYINGRTIYLTGQGTGMKAIRIDQSGNDFTPKELWSNNEVGAKWNTPVLKDGFLYGFTDQKRIYCIDSATGKTAWIDNAVNSDFATIVDCGKVIIGLPSTGNLIIFKPAADAYSEIKKYKVSETPVYTYPLLSGNKIYIKDSENLTLFED
jgi:outer membrane protein assembly factor BamB